MEINNNERNSETDNEIYFYTPVFYVLDNFSAYVVEIWGTKFPTAEHAYQWNKFFVVQPEIAEEILHASSPSAVKKISDLHKSKVPAVWHENKLQIMEEILTAKANQHEKVQRMLKASGGKKLIENSPIDDYWGAGVDGTGQNMLGKLWMKVRGKFPQ